MTDKYKGLETIFGTFYPKGFVVAVFETQEECTQAADALRNAQFDDVRQFTDQEVIDRYRTVTEGQNIAQRIGAAIATDEHFDIDEYVESAREGHHFLVTRAATPEQIEQVREVLFAHNAHGAKRFGEWTVQDLMAG
jgi:hypothetical protein